ncbi:MAG: aspartate/glutamate racemase family protein [Pseudomonadota bacterium]
MKSIGLIGGMSWESTAVYYRLINEGIRDACGGLTSASILLHSMNFSDVVALQKEDRWSEAGALLGGAGAGLVAAGAECLLICTNTMHLVANDVGQIGRAPVIDIIDETAQALRKAAKSRPLLLATRYTMEHGFYAAQMARHGIDILTPTAEDRQTVHEVIFDELCQGQIRDSSRAQFEAIVAKAKARGADSVILGCTEISLLLAPEGLALPGYDSTRIHAEAAVRFALETRTQAEAA